MVNRIIDFPPEAFDLSNYRNKNKLTSVEQWWINGSHGPNGEGVTPEWGKLNNAQSILFRDIVKTCNDIEKLCKCTKDQETISYFYSLYKYLESLLEVIKTIHP